MGNEYEIVSRLSICAVGSDLECVLNVIFSYISLLHVPSVLFVHKSQDTCAFAVILHVVK